MRNYIVLLFVMLDSICFGQATNNNSIVDASTTNTPATYAIVIGISKYKEITPLKYADRDAQIFSNYLLSKSGMNLDSGNVKLFLNDKATINNIGNALSDIIIKNLKKGDRIIFYFAGHGDYDAKIFKDQALLLLYGAPHQNYFQNIFTGDFISTADLNSRFIDPLTAKGCEVMLIIDACHASGMNRNLSGGAEGGKITMMALQNMTSPIKIYSCQANQYSLEGEEWGGGRGLFSYVLMEGLYGMADADKNKTVNLRELQRYLEDNVPILAAPIKQDPIVKVENATESIASVDDAFLASYKAQKDKNLVFTAKAGTKSSIDPWMQNKDSLLSKLYIECDSLIGRNELDIAYQKFLTIAGKDSSSDASLNLRRNLSAALQKKAASILTPMLEDVRIFGSSEEDVLKAKSDLQKAALLLGEKNFLYKNLRARILFLASLIFKENKTGANAYDVIDSLELSSALEPNAPYTYYYLGAYYRQKGELKKADSNLEKYLNLIPSSWWAQTNLGFLNFNTGRYEEAENYFLRAVEISGKPHESGYSQGYAKSLYNLGLLYQRLGKSDKAEFLFIQAKDIWEKALNRDNISYFQCLYDLGMLYFEKQEYVKSESLLVEAKKLAPSLLSEYNPFYLKILFILSEIYNRTGQHEKLDTVTAERRDIINKVFKNAVPIEGGGGVMAETPDNGLSDFNLCELFAERGDIKQALQLLELALKNGYNDLKNIQLSKSIGSLRTLPDFKMILKRHFSDKELSAYPKIFIVN